MKQSNRRVELWDKENRSSNISPDPAQTNVLSTETFNNLLAHSREVVLYVANDKKGTVEAISDSISAYGYLPEDFTSGKLSLCDIVHPDDFIAAVEYTITQMKKGVISFEQEYRIITPTDECIQGMCW